MPLSEEGETGDGRMSYDGDSRKESSRARASWRKKRATTRGETSHLTTFVRQGVGGCLAWLSFLAI